MAQGLGSNALPESRLEGRANEAFKSVRDRLRRYRPLEVIQQCVTILNSPKATNEIFISRYPPWSILLLIKWTLIYGNFDSARFRQLTGERFEKLVDSLHEYGKGAVRLYPDKCSRFLFFHRCAFQQFWFQRRREYPRLARQHEMFANSHESLQQVFQSQTGVTIGDFLELGLILLAPMYNKKSFVVRRRNFRRVEDAYAQGTVEAFLGSLSLDISQARRYLVDQQAGGAPSRFYEYYEEPALGRYPLLRYRDGFVPYSPYLLYHSLQTFVYDVLKAGTPDLFMGKFGPLFQTYVQRAIEYAQWNFLTEDQLKKRLDCSDKIVDFLIHDERTHVFVEAKGVEMADLGKVSHSPDVVKDKIKDSLIKAIKQAYATARQAKNVCHRDDAQTAPEDNYLIVVTFKDFYIGNGCDLHDFVAEDVIKRIIEDYGKEWIPIENIYFLSIDEFEILAEAFRGWQQGLVECLKKAVEADKDPMTKKFVFQQHLEVQLKELAFPSYLRQAHFSLAQRVKNRLKKES